MFKSLWVSFATGLGTAVFNLLSTRLRSPIAGEDRGGGKPAINIPANVVDLSTYGAFVKQQGLANATLWQDDERRWRSPGQRDETSLGLGPGGDGGLAEAPTSAFAAVA
jgi:hypothetical protein